MLKLCNSTKGVCILKVTDRYEWIMQYLKAHQEVQSKEIAEQLNVSFETIRRDFEKLEMQGKLKRIHGGAVYTEPKTETEKTFLERENLFAEQKKQLAKKAMRFVKEGMSIALDVSTTNTAVARQLAKHFTRLTIVTNSLPIIEIVAKVPTFSIIIPGGMLYNQERCIVGDVAVDHIRKYNIDLFFMSLSGIDLKKGLSDYGVEEMKVKQAFINQANDVVIVADHSKFDTISLINFELDQEEKLIVTDNDLDNSVKDKYLKYYKII